MGDRTTRQDGGSELEGTPLRRLCKLYESAQSLRDDHGRNLAHGALFVPTLEIENLVPGDPVVVALDLVFCDEAIDVRARVVGIVAPALSEAGGTPGVSVQILEAASELSDRLAEALGESLSESTPAAPTVRVHRAAPRFTARTPVLLESMDRQFPAESVDVSYGGLLALVPGLDLSVSTELRVTLEDPSRDDALVLDGVVARQLRCDHGYIALGIQFRYPAEEIDRVREFVDGLRGYQRARDLGTVSGSLKENPVDEILESFAAISPHGTLRLESGSDDGRIAFGDGELLYALTGLVAGIKALSRMFAWTEGRFEFEPTVEPMDRTEDPRPLEGAILEAAVERDQISRLDISAVGFESTFRIDEARLDQVRQEVDELSLEIANYAGLGFPVSVILDVLTQGDAAIFAALGQLLDAGIIAPDALRSEADSSD